MASSPIFYYDFSSPYAYLAASRVDTVLPVVPEWCPIAFGVIVQRLKKVPWSFAEDRSADIGEIARRAADRGLPPIAYPDGWPAQTYSLIPLRAATVVTDQNELRALSAELYRAAFVDGRHLADRDTVLGAVERAGLDREAVAAAITSPETKERLRARTESALARGVSGVPTVAIGERLFWGDDRLEAAAAALAG